MKPTELMIGDWYYWEAEGKKYPLQVTKETFALADEDIANFEPVPINPDILEKNGFVQCGEDSLYPQYNECTYRFSDNRGHVVILEYIGWGHGYYNVHDITTIHDVHELQHIFKIKKIKREIVV